MSSQEDLSERCADIIGGIIGKKPIFRAASTDCNIPLSLEVPAVSIGVYRGALAHTRGEWVEKASLTPGLEVGIRIALMLI